MLVKGNRKRLVIGLWVLAALLILWYNASMMTSLLDKPLPGLSQEARATITKWQRLENYIASGLKEMMDPEEIEKIVARIDFIKEKAVLPVQQSEPVAKAIKILEPSPKKIAQLPSLSGIVVVYDTDGNVVYLAVIDGKTREEKSSIGKFVLEKIEADGVLLAQGREKWFVPAPAVDFSMDTSMEE